MILGVSGSGKSAVANALTDSKSFDEGDHNEDGSYDPKKVCRHFLGKKENVEIEVWDTPGFLDSDEPDDMRILESVMQFLADLADGYNVILFCHSAAYMGQYKKVKDVYELVVDLIGEEHTDKIRWVYTNLNKLHQRQREPASLNRQFEKLKKTI